MTVCLQCGVEVAQSKARGWIHIAEIPRAFPAHDAAPVDQATFEANRKASATIVPIEEARRWAADMRDRMLREEHQGVQWSDEARHAVVLLNVLEELEEKVGRMVGSS